MEGATRVFGDSRAAWFKDGRYFDGQQNEITPEEAAQPAEVEPVEIEPVVDVEIDDPLPGELPSSAPSPQPVGVAAVLRDFEASFQGSARPSPAPEPDKDPPARVDVLGAMNVSALAKLVRTAGGEPAKGKGAREANIRWLLDHTTD